MKSFNLEIFFFVLLLLFLGERKCKRKHAVPVSAKLKVAESARKNSFSYRFCFDVPGFFFFFLYIFFSCPKN